MKKHKDNKSAGEAKHWSEHAEKAGLWQMVLFFLLFKVLPPLLLSLMAYPVGFGYFLFSKKGRAESWRFLRRYEAHAAALHPNTAALSALKHMVAFALAVVEKVQAWSGRISLKHIHFQKDDIDKLLAELEQKKGAVLLCSHLGNAELLRALADRCHTGVSREVPVTSILDFDVTPFFNRLLNSLNPRSSLKIINAKSINPGSIIALQEETARGGLAVIAGDRTAALNKDFCLALPFLGAPAAFPRGPFLLASLLEAPTYAVFALRQKTLSPFPHYDMHVHSLGTGEGGGGKGEALSRGERSAQVEAWARQYAALLESHLLEHPYQWYNFYDFWG